MVKRIKYPAIRESLKREIQKSRKLAEAISFPSASLFLLLSRYEKQASQRFIIQAINRSLCAHVRFSTLFSQNRNMTFVSLNVL